MLLTSTVTVLKMILDGAHPTFQRIPDMSGIVLGSNKLPGVKTLGKGCRSLKAQQRRGRAKRLPCRVCCVSIVGAQGFGRTQRDVAFLSPTPRCPKPFVQRRVLGEG